MSLCDPGEGMHAHFGGWLPRQIFADLPRDVAGGADLDELLAARRHELAGVIIEPLVQGAGGMIFHDPSVLAEVARLCRRHGLLLIADEVFTGFGRTGSMFACEQAEVVPDILCLSKALTGGVMPLAAALARSEVFETFWSDDPAAALMHGPTFMANPLACAAANASLDLFSDEPRLTQALALEAALAEGLAPCAGLPGVLGVRAKGGVGVVHFDRPVDREALKRAFVDRGVWLRPFGDIVYLTPALNISAADLGHLAMRHRGRRADDPFLDFHLRAAEVRPVQLCVGQVRLEKPRLPGVCAAEVGPLQLSAAEVGADQATVAQGQRAKPGLAQVGPHQLRVLQLGAAQVRAAQIRVAKIASPQVGALHLHAPQGHLEEDRLRRDQGCEIEPVEGLHGAKIHLGQDCRSALGAAAVAPPRMRFDHRRKRLVVDIEEGRRRAKASRQIRSGQVRPDLADARQHAAAQGRSGQISAGYVRARQVGVVQDRPGHPRRAQARPA